MYFVPFTLCCCLNFYSVYFIATAPMQFLNVAAFFVSLTKNKLADADE